MDATNKAVPKCVCGEPYTIGTGSIGEDKQFAQLATQWASDYDNDPESQGTHQAWWNMSDFIDTRAAASRNAGVVPSAERIIELMGEAAKLSKISTVGAIPMTPIQVAFIVGNVLHDQAPTIPDAATREPDGFKGDTPALCRAIDALLALDAADALRPHGVGGHGRSLLTAAASRLRATTAPDTSAPADSSSAAPIHEHEWEYYYSSAAGPRGGSAYRCECGATSDTNAPTVPGAPT